MTRTEFIDLVNMMAQGKEASVKIKDNTLYVGGFSFGFLREEPVTPYIIDDQITPYQQGRTQTFPSIDKHVRGVTK